MISDEDLSFLTRAIDEINTSGRVDQHRFVEDDIDTFLAQRGLTKQDLSQPWRSFFAYTDEPLCKNCGALQPDCQCHSSDFSDGYYTIKPEKLFTEWVDRLDEKGWFEILSTERLGDIDWRLSVESDSIGEVTFRVFFDGDKFANYAPNPLKRKFPVGFLNSQHAKDEEHVFYWSETLDDGFWKNLYDDLLSYSEPLAYSLCRTDSSSYNSCAEDIEDALWEYYDSELEEPEEQVQLLCPKVNEYIDISEARFGVSDEEGRFILLCNCDADPDHLHFHLFDGDSLIDAKSSDLITEPRREMRELVKEYNRHSEGRQDLSPLVKVMAPILAVVNIGPAIPILQNIQLGVSVFWKWVLLGLLVAINIFIFVGAIYYVLKPAIAIRGFNWSIV